MNPDIFLSPKANSYNGSNDTKIIRSSLDQFYFLPKDEIVTTFVVGSQILTKNQSDTFTKTIQQKVSEQQSLLESKIIDAVDTRILNKNPSIAKPIYSTQDHDAPLYIRNTDCWAYDLDLTSISPWNSTEGKNRAGTLISPRHVLFCEHLNYYPDDGATIRFITSDNNIITKTITSVIGHQEYFSQFRSRNFADIAIGVLDSDVPSSISFAKVLPQDWKKYIPNLDSSSLYGSPEFTLPTLNLDAEEKALVGDLFNLSISAVFIQPVDSTRLSFYESIISGDSGNPSFLIINNELVLITVWSSGGPGLGSNIIYTGEGYPGTEVDYVQDINTMMSVLGGGYSLTHINLQNILYT